MLAKNPTNRNSDGQNPKFNILDHLDKLIHHKGDKYICPVCGNNNLSIPPNADTEGYKCFNGCDCRDIREAIAPWADRQSEGKAKQPEQKRQWTYCDADRNPVIRVNRADDGQGNKKIWQEYDVGGTWQSKADSVPKAIKAHAKAVVMPYRYHEAISAAAEGQRVFWVEGEQCADALWGLGLPAVTTIGGSDGYNRYGDYSKLFAGVDLVICPDRDQSGLKYANAIATDYPQAQWLYAYADAADWGNLPKSGGLDVADWIASGADKVAIEAAVGQRRTAQPQTINLGNLVLFPGSDQPEEIDKSEVDQAIELSQSVADIASLLPSLYPVLAAKAARFNVPIEGLVGMLLPIGGSLLSTAVKIKIEEGYLVSPIIWCGLVGGSGGAKSPQKDSVDDPLKSLQTEVYSQFDSDRKFYEQQLKAYNKKKEGEEPEEPQKLRHYYTSDFTVESVIKILAEQPGKGLAVTNDELKGFFKSFGEYKSDGGGDRAKWLTIYNGKPIKSDRKTTGTLMVQSSNVSVAGTIQPAVLRKLMADAEEVDGLWPRFLWFWVPDSRMPAPGEVPAIDITEILKDCYIRLSSYAGETCVLSTEAQKHWVSWHHYTEDCKLGSASQAVQAIYPKAREQAARVALIAHHLEAAAQGIAPSGEISADTLLAAISLVKYCINQALLIYGSVGVTDANPEAIRIAKFVERFAGQEVSWKQLRPILPKVRVGKTRRAANKSECCDFLKRIVDFGYGVAQSGDYSAIVVNEPPSDFEFEFTIEDDAEVA